MAPTHELLKRIQNPSLKFNKLIGLIEGMIALKHEVRMSVEELEDVLMWQEPFREMKIPIEGQEETKTTTTPPPTLLPTPY